MAPACLLGSHVTHLLFGCSRSFSIWSQLQSALHRCPKGRQSFCSLWNSQMSEAAQMQSVCGLNADFLPLMVSILSVSQVYQVSLSTLKKSRIFWKNTNYSTKGNLIELNPQSEIMTKSLPQLLLCWKYGGCLIWSWEAPNHLMFQLHLWGCSLLGSSCGCKPSQGSAVICAELSQPKFGLCHLHDKRPALLCGVRAGVWRHWVC